MISRLMDFQKISIPISCLPVFALTLSLFHLFYLFLPVSIHAGDYHIGSENLYCSDCHTMHYSQDGTIPDDWGQSGPYAELLKKRIYGLCLMCHDGTYTLAPDVMEETRYVSSAGSFASSDPNRRHSVRLVDFDDDEIPPGYSGTGYTGPLTCVSCHNPHGNPYYRNLRPDPGGITGINITVTYETGIKESYGGSSAIQQLVKTPVTEHYKVENILYRQSELSENYGLSAWCGGCHTDFYGEGGEVNMGGSSSGDTKESNTDTWIQHPTIGIALSQGVTNGHIDGSTDGGLGYWWSSLVESRPPYISPSAIPPGDTGNSKSNSDNEAGCVSCHKAHGSDQLYCLLFDNPETGTLEDGAPRMTGTCQSCHWRGEGNYEMRHGNTMTGLSRDTRWEIGDCQHCHAQHAGNPYNLFTANTNSLCYTGQGCHGNTPIGGTAGYPAQEDDRAPSTSSYPGYFEYFSGLERKAGVNDRVRWPGASVFEDPNTYTPGPPERFFSPHRNDPHMPKKDANGKGLCINCHSPHGTTNIFDMLTETYLNIGGAGETGRPANYELCFSCHRSGGPAGMDDETKRIADFYNDTLNPIGGGHRIRKSPGSASYWPPHVQAGDKLSCSNCHNPHGSRGHDNNNKPNARLLSDQRPGWNDLTDTLHDAAHSRRFCFGCHVPSDDPNCSGYLSGCPEVDGIQMAALPGGMGMGHDSGSNMSCYGSGMQGCHGNDYSSPTSNNVHNPRLHQGGGGTKIKAKGLMFPPPTGLVATGGKRLVELVWDKYPDENIRGYHLYRSQIPGGPYERIGSEPDCMNRCIDRDILPERNYYYVMTVEDVSGGESPYSAEAAATPTSLTPGQLISLEEVKGLTGMIKGEKIILTWEEGTDELVAGYHIYRHIEGEERSPVLLTRDGPIKWPVYEDREIVKGNIYIYSVVAVDRMANEARFPRQVRVAFKSLYITSVSLSQGEKPLKGGEEMVVTLTGSSNGKGYCDIEGLAARIPIEEVEETGTYMGKYVVPGEVEYIQARVTCFLEDLTGDVTFMTAPVPLKIDNHPPSPPENLSAAIDPDGYVSLSWSLTEGEDTDIASYMIYRGLDEDLLPVSDARIASVLPREKKEYKDLAAMPGKRYLYIVTAVDEAGNESGFSRMVDVLLPADTTPPDIAEMKVAGGIGGVWRPGDSISLLMVGEPGCEASFSIGTRIKDMPMIASQPGRGRYEGRYIFQDGDTGMGMPVTGRFTDPSGNSTLHESRIRVSVVQGPLGPAPEIREGNDNSFRIGGTEGLLIASDVLNVNIRGTPGCYASFSLGGFVDEGGRLTIDWSGFRDSEHPDISGYHIYRGTLPQSSPEGDALLAGLGLGERQFHLPEGMVIDSENAFSVAAMDRNGHPKVIATPQWDIPLTETRDRGVYEGEYRVQPGDRIIQGYIFASLKDKFGRSSLTYQSGYPLTIDTGSRIEVRTQPSEIRADSLSRSRVIIQVRDLKGNWLVGRNVELSIFTTSEYSGIVGLGSLNQTDIGYLKDTSPQTMTDNQGKGLNLFTTDDYGQIKADYQAGFAAKSIIFRAMDQVTGDVGLGYCTAYIEAQAQVEQYLSASRMKTLGQQYAITLSASPEWLTADGVSTSRITACISSQGGEPVSGHKIVFSISMGDGRLFQQEGITDQRGFAEVTYGAGTRIGTVEIRAVDMAAYIEARTYIILKSDAPAVISVTAEPERIPADGQGQCRLHITVTDINGNPSRGAGVVISMIKGDGRILEADEVTDFMGNAEAIYQSGDEPGKVLFNVRVTSKIPTSEELEEIRWTIR